jgi:hypothetical protein
MSTIQNHAICKRQLLLYRISENSRTKWMEGYIWALADEYLHNNGHQLAKKLQPWYFASNSVVELKIDVIISISET